MDFFGVSGTVRLSLAVYNTSEELDISAKALSKIEKMFEEETQKVDLAKMDKLLQSLST